MALTAERTPVIRRVRALTDRPEGRFHFAKPVRIELLILTGLIIAGSTFRVWMMARANWMIDADEAITGLMGNHIRQGERPIFFYGQPYMGSLQAYFAAVSYTLFGMSRVALKLITLPEFAAFALSVYLLGRRAYDGRAALLATALAAFPSVYVLSVTGRTWGPTLDSLTVGNVILLLTIDHVYRGDRWRRPWLRFFLSGLLGGFGFWLHSQTLIYLATAAILFVLHDKRVLLSLRLPVAVAGFLLGALPVSNYALDHDYSTFDHLLSGGRDDLPREYLAVARYYLGTVVPEVAGLTAPWVDDIRPLRLLAGLVVAGTLVALAVRRRRGLLGWLRLSLRHGQPRDALILFCLVMSAAFILSDFGRVGLQFLREYQFDATGRYGIPLASVLPIVIAGELSDLWRRPRLQPLAGAALLVLAAAIAVGYVRSTPDDIWQSHYWRAQPESNRELIAALDELDVEAVWMNHWVGKPLIFDSRERISAADYADLFIGHGADRLAGHTSRVRSAGLPAFVFLRDGQEVTLEYWLISRDIPYDKRVVTDYVVIHPWRRVEPETVAEHLRSDPLPSARRLDPGTTSPDWTYVPETGHYLALGFRDFWLRHSGQAVLGLPLTEEFQDPGSAGGPPGPVQYFEYGLLEYHPELAGSPDAIQLAPLGRQSAQRRGLLDDPAFQLESASPAGSGDCQFFAETGHRLCGDFLAYWQSRGLELGDPNISFRESLALFGAPISQPFVDPASGKTVQYFERARLEQESSSADELRILPARLGAEALAARGWIAPLPNPNRSP